MFQLLSLIAIALSLLLLCAGFLVFLYIRLCARRKVPGYSVGFFHPYSNAGGGGERVLWMAIKAMEQLPQPDLTCLLYSGDDVSGDFMLNRAKERFGIDIDAKKIRLNVIKLQKRHLVEAERYPRFTMLGQSIGSFLLAWEALKKATPTVFLDTAGYAFAYPLARLFGARVGCYTHYPTITTEMLDKVRERRPDYNNSDAVTGSASATAAKLLYYRVFSKLYSFVGSFAQAVMVNSTWTKNHIDALWGKSTNAVVVYPPCNTEKLKDLNCLSLAEQQNLAGIKAKSRTIVSVAQFRPEKDHALQVRAMAALKALGPKYHDIRLEMIGACRNEEDEQRVQALKTLVQELDVQDNVEFRVNIPFPSLQKALALAAAGLHTMWNEHFGIGIVEMMAAGAVPIAHNSGGPKSDIVKPNERGVSTGFLAATPEEYAKAIQTLFDGKGPAGEPIEAVREAGRQSVDRFSDEVFVEEFLRVAKRVL